jgi:hypothetical protein
VRRALILATVLLTAGCGGDDGGGPLTKEEFEREANAICAAMNRDLSRLGQPESSQEFVEQLEAGQRRLREALRELEQLDAPPEYERDFRTLLRQGDEAVATINELIAAGESQDAEEFAEIAERAEKADAESDKVARRLGLDECATG